VAQHSLPAHSHHLAAARPRHRPYRNLQPCRQPQREATDLDVSFDNVHLDAIH
jgi:hypothetical protein